MPKRAAPTPAWRRRLRPKIATRHASPNSPQVRKNVAPAQIPASGPDRIAATAAASTRPAQAMTAGRSQRFRGRRAVTGASGSGPSGRSAGRARKIRASAPPSRAISSDQSA